MCHSTFSKIKLIELEYPYTSTFTYMHEDVIRNVSMQLPAMYSIKKTNRSVYSRINQIWKILVLLSLAILQIKHVLNKVYCIFNRELSPSKMNESEINIVLGPYRWQTLSLVDQKILICENNQIRSCKLRLNRWKCMLHKIINTIFEKTVNEASVVLSRKGSKLLRTALSVNQQLSRWTISALKKCYKVCHQEKIKRS